MYTLYILLIASVLVTFSYGAKILVVFPMASHSHYILGFRLAKKLADRGHEVTYINAFPQKEPIKNLRDISTAEIKELDSECHTNKFVIYYTIILCEI